MVYSSEQTMGGQIAESPTPHSNRTGFRCQLLTNARSSGVNWMQDAKCITKLSFITASKAVGMLYR
jgi:hypothetical protein